MAPQWQQQVSPRDSLDDLNELEDLELDNIRNFVDSVCFKSAPAETQVEDKVLFRHVPVNQPITTGFSLKHRKDVLLPSATDNKFDDLLFSYDDMSDNKGLNKRLQRKEDAMIKQLFQASSMSSNPQVKCSVNRIEQSPVAQATSQQHYVAQDTSTQQKRSLPENSTVSSTSTEDNSCTDAITTKCSVSRPTDLPIPSSTSSFPRPTDLPIPSSTSSLSWPENFGCIELEADDLMHCELASSTAGPSEMLEVSGGNRNLPLYDIYFGPADLYCEEELCLDQITREISELAPHKLRTRTHADSEIVEFEQIVKMQPKIEMKNQMEDGRLERGKGVNLEQNAGGVDWVENSAKHDTLSTVAAQEEFHDSLDEEEEHDVKKCDDQLSSLSEDSLDDAVEELMVVSPRLPYHDFASPNLSQDSLNESNDSYEQMSGAAYVEQLYGHSLVPIADEEVLSSHTDDSMDEKRDVQYEEQRHVKKQDEQSEVRDEHDAVDRGSMIDGIRHAQDKQEKDVGQIEGVDRLEDMQDSIRQMVDKSDKEHCGNMENIENRNEIEQLESKAICDRSERQVEVYELKANIEEVKYQTCHKLKEEDEVEDKGCDIRSVEEAKDLEIATAELSHDHNSDKRKGVELPENNYNCSVSATEENVAFKGDQKETITVTTVRVPPDNVLLTAKLVESEDDDLGESDDEDVVIVHNDNKNILNTVLDCINGKNNKENTNELIEDCKVVVDMLESTVVVDTELAERTTDDVNKEHIEFYMPKSDQLSPSLSCKPRKSSMKSSGKRNGSLKVRFEEAVRVRHFESISYDGSDSDDEFREEFDLAAVEGELPFIDSGDSDSDSDVEGNVYELVEPTQTVQLLEEETTVL